MTTTFSVHGKPQPQGSTRAFVVNGRAVTTSANKNLAHWRQLVSDVAQRHAHMHEGPVRLAITFFIPRPKARKKETWCVTRPDIDKAARAVLDSLTHIMYRDDSQVARLEIMKVYESESCPPGVLIEVTSEMT